MYINKQKTRIIPMRYSPLGIHNPLPRNIIVMEMMVDFTPLIILVCWVGVIASIGREMFEADAYLTSSSGCVSIHSDIFLVCM